ncbi:MAG: pitrilysin family protein [Flavobacteriales bacterium]|nr:pitrilysin family protein [Flavobacteriales bacterium]
MLTARLGAYLRRRINCAPIPAPTDMSPDSSALHQFTLPNGLRCVHLEAGRNVGHCGLLIEAGSRDELESENGLAHFIEHTLFKGTKKRRTFHILNRLDSVGAELNAYTSKEETWITSSFLSEHLERSMELIADIAFSATFPEKEIVKERDVIIDEIHSWRDSPGDAIFDEFEEMLFPEHALGRNILGDEKSVSRFGRADILSFIERQYRNDRLVFSSVGPVKGSHVEKLCIKYFSQHTTGTTEARRLAPAKYTPERRTGDHAVHQVHHVTGNIAGGMDAKDRIATLLLSNYLGGPGMNARLNLTIRERYGICYNIESSYVPYSDIGEFLVYFGTDLKNFARAEQLVHRELKLAREKRMGVVTLHQAKQQLIGQIALGSESGSGWMSTMGKSVMLYDRVEPMAETIAGIESVTAEEILESANKLLDPARLSHLTYRPKA